MVAQNPLTAAHIAAFGPGVHLVARTGSGLDAINLDAPPAARPRLVYHVPDYCTAEVATQAMALISPSSAGSKATGSSAPSRTTGGR